MARLLVISGASAGIGKATAAKFIEDNWEVVNLSRRAAPVAGVNNIAVDLARAGFLEKIRPELEPKLAAASQICLIHNAALLNKDSLQTLTEITFRRVLELSLVAPQVVNRFILPFMGPDSSILYVGSTLSEKAVPGAFSYVVSKHAQVGMMRATCQDLAGTGIHTAAICPGFTNTEMLNQHLNHDEEVLAAVRSMTAYNRLVEPEEIAEVLHFAATHPVLNGAVLHANLGQLER